MAVRLDKPWLALERREIECLAGHLGVYQLGDESGEVLFIGVADARSRFGLRGELLARLENAPPGATRFRYEVNMMYRSRHIELLAAHVHDHGRLPVANDDIEPGSLGRLRPG